MLSRVPSEMEWHRAHSLPLPIQLGTSRPPGRGSPWQGCIRGPWVSTHPLAHTHTSFCTPCLFLSSPDGTPAPPQEVPWIHALPASVSPMGPETSVPPTSLGVLCEPPSLFGSPSVSGLTWAPLAAKHLQGALGRKEGAQHALSCPSQASPLFTPVQGTVVHVLT